jgi:uncharacterized membrane protein
MSNSQYKEPKMPLKERLTAIDAMRGLVMILMALDHASHAFNAGRYVTDSAGWYVPGSEIPAAQFMIRWVTHLCAPTFLFLAGFVLALSVARRQTHGESDRTLDGFLIKRGIFIILLDPFWMSLGFGAGIIFQVLYAIGGSFCCMVLLRRIGDRSLLAIGLALFLFGPLLAALALWAGGGQSPGIFGAFLITGGRIVKGVYVLYPLLPWLTYMIVGFICGRFMLLKAGTEPIRFFLMAGLASLLVFGVVRGLNGYGNMGLLRDNLSLLQWLHVSKYPPSLSFATLELSLMFLILALLFAWYKNRTELSSNPLLVFGRTPLFFYVIHVHLLTAVSWILGMHRTGGLKETFAAAVLELIVLYPICRWYAQIKRIRPGSFLRYI